MKSFYLGIAGKMGSGKDEVAKMLVSRFKFTRVALADALKEEVERHLESGTYPKDLGYLPIDTALEIMNLLDVSRKLSISPWAKPTPPTMRRLLQLWGTEFRRAINPGYWVDMLKHTATARRLPFVVVPDVRFVDELLAMDYNWQVVRPGEQYTDNQDHVSEHALEGTTFDVTIDNSKSLEWLEECVEYQIRKLSDSGKAEGLLERLSN